jgi:bifunctional non-homologous end joining protein LigD
LPANPGKAVPSGKEWSTRSNNDGYRIRVERDDDRVRLITKGGYDLTGCFPWIVEAARRNRTRRFVIDGEAVVLCLNGIARHGASMALSQSTSIGLIVAAGRRTGSRSRPPSATPLTA